jgi:hypothetical protein
MLRYTAIIAGVSVSAQQDLFQLVAPAAGLVTILELEIAQISDYGDAAAEGLGLQFMRGHTTTGSGGSSVTPNPITGKISQVAGTGVMANNTTVATGGTPLTIYASGWNIAAGHPKVWIPETRLVLRNAERGVFRMTAPADAITVYATLTIGEE